MERRRSRSERVMGHGAKGSRGRERGKEEEDDLMRTGRLLACKSIESIEENPSTIVDWRFAWS